MKDLKGSMLPSDHWETTMDSLKVGDKVGLCWIKGNGNAKIVAVYQDYAMVIHPCYNKPIVVHRFDLVLPE